MSAPYTIAFRSRRIEAAENEGVAKEHAEGGHAIQQHAAQEVGIGEHATGLLADAEEFGPKIVLHLGAVEGVVDGQSGDDVLAVEETVLALDIVELDGEAVGGADQFVLGEKE